MAARSAPTGPSGLQHAHGLLPRGLRVAGYGLVLAGVLVAFLRFRWGLKPGILDRTVFAMRSEYIEVRSFALVRNNLAEEVAGLLLLAGLFAVAFSPELREDAGTATARQRALVASFYLNALLAAGGFVFLYGLAYAQALMVLPFSQLIFFILARWYFIRRGRSAAPRSGQVAP